MKDFKKRRFGGKPSHKGGFRSAPRRDFSGRGEMYETTCAHCQKTCKVPFRPNGRKPVFCKDCFENGKTDAPSRPRESVTEANNKGDMAELESKVEMLGVKLDTLIRMVEALKKE